MKQVAIVGIGMGADSCTAQALRRIESAQLLIGGRRMLEEFAHLRKPSIAAFESLEILNAVEKTDAEDICVLVSGDVGFYSAASSALVALEDYSVTMYPGISSVSYFFSKVGLPWQDAKLMSLHGKRGNAVDAVRRNRLTFFLTGGNSAELGEQLAGAGFGELRVYAGEDLGSADECIQEMSVSGLKEADLSSLCVLIIENRRSDKRLLTGIADKEFFRVDEIPMTKSEVRAVIMSRLSLSPGDICYDIGAGSGSVTVEMALSAYEGRVYAIEKNEAARSVIRENLSRFQLGNVTSVFGNAPEILAELPAPDAVFVGGSTGRFDEILSTVLLKNPSARIVASAIAVESVYGALMAFERLGISDIETVQISASRAKRAGSLHLMTAQNPITIISGGGVRA